MRVLRGKYQAYCKFHTKEEVDKAVKLSKTSIFEGEVFSSVALVYSTRFECIFTRFECSLASFPFAQLKFGKRTVYSYLTGAAPGVQPVTFLPSGGWGRGSAFNSITFLFRKKLGPVLWKYFVFSLTNGPVIVMEL